MSCKFLDVPSSFPFYINQLINMSNQVLSCWVFECLLYMLMCDEYNKIEIICLPFNTLISSESQLPNYVFSIEAQSWLY